MKLSKSKIAVLIFVALAAGFIYFLPNILIPHFYNEAHGSNYTWRDVRSFDFEEMFSYGVSVRDVVDGHVIGGDPYLWEYKDMPTGWDYYPLSVATGLFLKLFNINDISPLFRIGDFVFPIVSFIIIFFLFFWISKNFFFSIVSSIIFLFFPNVFVFRDIFSSNFYNNFELIKITNLFAGSFNGTFSRIFVPALTMIFLNTFLLFLYYSVSKGKIKKIWLVLCGISYGILFYIYFYYWVFATISLGFLFIFFLFYKREIFWRIFRILIYGLIVSIPFWIKFFILAGNPIYDELVNRVGLLKGRIFIAPAAGYWAVLFIFIFFGMIFWKKMKQNNLFFYTLSLLLTILVVRNLQLIFGFNPQPDHWGSRITVYIMVLAIIVAVFLSMDKIFKRYKKSLSFILFASILFLLTMASVVQFRDSQSSAYSRDIFFVEENLMDSFEWIDKNTEKDSVILSNSNLMRTALPFFTHSNVYVPQACLSLASNGEILDRYREVYSIYGTPAALLKDALDNNYEKYTQLQQMNISNGFGMFCVMYYKLEGDKVIATETPDSVKKEFIEKYKITRPDIKNLKYRADYLFYGPYEQLISDFDADKYPELELAYSNNSVKIYKILK
ncbi:hypothetical protein KJ885_02325 [Patescibacteria group bacterium]|nr:hypothetical protein [Patescibacteria group bacterium]